MYVNKSNGRVVTIFMDFAVHFLPAPHSRLWRPRAPILKEERVQLAKHDGVGNCQVQAFRACGYRQQRNSCVRVRLELIYLVTSTVRDRQSHAYVSVLASKS